MNLQMELNCEGARVLIIGDDPAIHAVLKSLTEAGAMISRLESGEGEERYARRQLTPRPLLILLATADSRLRSRVVEDSRERGILLVDLLAASPESGHAMLLDVESL